ncbi:unnamed protein product [Ambrosiozyma monospora]|uniref:Unnamed protein product n=1 Tax=Ambrosiozyma monospora TaxID=43982 RepID=A0A9W6YZM2_AMBMO|nr:unnamed protein product [Ambrosiozyma monospora]
MQLFSIFNALLLGSAMAQPIGHIHHQHAKRDEVVVVTETHVVTVNGEGQTIDYVHASADSTTESATTTQAAQVAPTTTTSYSPAATTAAETSSSSSSSSAAAASETGNFSGSTKGITYSPYSSSGACKSAEEVASDLAKLSEYSLIRLYGVDCNQVENVFKGKADGQKLMLGIFDMGSISDAVSTIASAVESCGSWDDVTTVSVGNELVNNGEATPSQIKEYIATARSALTSAGYSGKVVSVDTHVAIINNPELCEYSDYIVFNAHSYWDGTIYPDGAGAWLLLQMQRVSNACGGKQVLCAETGWPTQGDANGVAVPSKENQQTALSSIASSCGSAAVAFNAFNDLWKNPGSKNVEQYWGIY